MRQKKFISNKTLLQKIRPTHFAKVEDQYLEKFSKLIPRHQLPIYFAH
jgi:hypothetical protein